MKIEFNDMWKPWEPKELPAMTVVSTNQIVKKSGELVMGRGAAREATIRIPGIEKECGVAIDKAKKPYGFLVVRSPFREGKAGFGIFQVKTHWEDQADIDLIRNSCIRLREWMTEHPNVWIRMNYPGIGNGRLKRKDVDPVLWKELGKVSRLILCMKPFDREETQ